ncbi:MAG: queuosine precursor transporter [Oscillospiraceae bacterium]|nr:queuosine precursor transporter [Oscillospiraceae bacterium]
MINELLLAASLIFIFGAALVAYKIFGKAGLYAITAIATITANIECLILINAFGMEQTLGNVFFAVTFLVTDILSETEGKKEANRAVGIGIFTSLFFILMTQSWMLFVPSQADWVMPSIRNVFSNTPRMMISSLVVYAISQIVDVQLYHLWWKFTEKKFGDRRRFLWLRNNGSTLISQILNTALFTLFAFWGTYDMATLFSIMISSYAIFVVTSLCDTPAIYIARRIKENKDKRISAV